MDSVQKTIQQIAGVALDSLGINKLEDKKLISLNESLQAIEMKIRDLEKESNSVIEQHSVYRNSFVTITSSLSKLYGQNMNDSVVKESQYYYGDIPSRMNRDAQSKMMSDIKESITDNIEVRREILFTLRKHLQECNQDYSHLLFIAQNVQSAMNEKESSDSTLQELKCEYDEKRIDVMQKKIQLENDITSYITSTNSFLLQSYHHLGDLHLSMIGVIRSCLIKSAPERLIPDGKNGKTDMVEITVNAGDKTIYSLPMRKGGRIWWELKTIGGDIGIRVEYRTPHHMNEDNEIEWDLNEIYSYRRADSTKGEVIGNYSCEEDGEISMIFDNTYSFFRSKILQMNLITEQRQE